MSPPSIVQMMASNVLYNLVHTFIIVAIVSTVTRTVSGGTCEACNCQFNNVELLDQLIESKVASGKLATTIVKPMVNLNTVHSIFTKARLACLKYRFASVEHSKRFNVIQLQNGNLYNTIMIVS